MHRNYGAAIAKETHIIVFGNSRKDKTEIVEARTKQIIPIITETFVSGLGYALTPSSGAKLLANMRLTLRRKVEHIADRLEIDYVYERPEYKVLGYDKQKGNSKRKKNKKIAKKP